MALALSNFAWDREDDDIIFNKIKEIGFSNIECVLTKIKDWSELSTQDIIDYKVFLNKKKINPYSIQSLFYNVKCSGIDDVEVFISHFQKLIEYAKILETKVLVFGSPSLRKSIDNWENYMSIIFKDVDKLLKNTNIIVAIEPNAPDYGGDFFYDVSEIVNFIKKNNFINIRTMIDTHNLEMQNLNPTIEFLNYKEYISHIHVSEKGLVKIIPRDLHYSLSDKLRKNNYNGIITYEVNKCENLLNSINEFFKIYE